MAKCWNVNMARASSGATGVDHFNSRLIVFENGGGPDLRVTKFVKNRAKMLGDLGSFNGSKKFGLGARSNSDGLRVAPAGNQYDLLISLIK
jgi:hypothetical protein